MVLGANVLNAIGCSPAISKREFIPTYPGRLPGDVEDQLVLHLRPFSMDQLAAFIEVEEPRDPLKYQSAQAPQEAGTSTIGEFHTSIEGAIRKLPQGAFVHPPRNQVGPDLVWGSIAVTDLDSALLAINTIIEQGEGTGTSPEEIGGVGGVEDYAHFYRLSKIQMGAKLVQVPSPDPEGPQYANAGDAVEFNPQGVYAVPDDPTSDDYPVGSAERRRNDAFNYTYTTLLRILHKLGNGHHDEPTFNSAFALMKSLEHQAEAMVAGVEIPHVHVGPSFEYQPVNPLADQRRHTH